MCVHVFGFQVTILLGIYLGQGLLASALKKNYSLIFWSHYGACGILAPQPGIVPMPLAVTNMKSEPMDLQGNPLASAFKHFSQLSSLTCLCCRSATNLCLILCDPMNCSMPGFSVPHYLPEFAQTHICWASDANQQSHPLLSLSPLALHLSQHQSISKESTLHIRWPKYWSFRFNISPSNEHPGLISFRMDWLDLLALQGTLKSLLQHHSSKASILLCSAFFIIQLSHPYMTTGKTIAFTRWTFVDKAMSLLLNTLSRLVITFLPRSKRLLISWLQSPSAVILEPPKINSDTISTVSPSICHKWWAQMPWS